MSLIRTRRARGLTLIELLVVVTILSIIGGVVVVRTGQADRNARLAVSVSNMNDITRAIDQFYVTQDSHYPDGWDSLLDSTTSNTVYAGTGDPLVNSGIYNSNNWLAVSPITNSEYFSMIRVSSNIVGSGPTGVLVTVHHHDPTVTDANQSTNGQAATTVAASTDLAFVNTDPTSGGADIYDAFNLNQADTSFRLLALGIGPHNSIIGDAYGVTEAPVAADAAPNQDKSYRRYIALFKVFNSGQNFAQFVGVVTSYGKPVGTLRNYME